MSWDYKREENNSYTTKVPEGKHRIRIKEATKAVSKSGNDMLTLQFEISGYPDTLYHYIVFMADRPEITNRMLTQFFDSFADIPEGDFDTSHWIGKVGACVIKHEEYNGNVNAKVSYFISKDKQADLPAWKGSTDSTPQFETDENGFMKVPEGADGDIPF